MVAASDLKVYKTTNNLGGTITGTQISSATPNNLFSNIPKNELTIGEDYYACVHFKNTHATESMDNFRLWLTDKSFPHDTEVKWAYDPVGGNYFFDGINDYIDCTNDATLWSQSLTKFSFTFSIFPTAGWDGNDRVVLSHGGASNQGFRCIIDTANAGRIRFLIKNAAGTTFTAYSDTLALNEWNDIVCVYDNSLATDNLKIYVDMVVGTTTANLTEALNLSASLTLSEASTDFKGYMRAFVWWTNKALTASEVVALYNGEIPPYGTEQYGLPLHSGALAPIPLEDWISGSKLAIASGAVLTGDAQTIANKYTEPAGVVWKSLDEDKDVIKFTKFRAGEYFAVWLWYHVSANAVARLDDSALFSFQFEIPQGGTGTPGGGDTGGTGGNPPPVNADYKIAVSGDWGCEGETDDVITLIKDGDYDLLVGVGDNAYASPDCWINRFDDNSIKSIFKVSAYGNHEYSESGGTSPYKTFFGHNKTYYTHKFQNVFFAVFDTNIDFDSGSAQHTAMTSAITASLTDNTITWRIGVIHHPMFGADSDHSYNDNDFNQTWQTFLQNNKFNFVLAGHNHNWQRTKQVLYNSGNPESPTVVDSTSPFSGATRGIIHVISGTGGHDSGSSLYSVGSQPGFQGYQNRSHNGVWEIVASSNAQTLTCSFVDTSGVKYDTFTITAT